MVVMVELDHSVKMQLHLLNFLLDVGPKSIKKKSSIFFKIPIDLLLSIVPLKSPYRLVQQDY